MFSNPIAYNGDSGKISGVPVSKENTDSSNSKSWTLIIRTFLFVVLVYFAYEISAIRSNTSDLENALQGLRETKAVVMKLSNVHELDPSYIERLVSTMTFEDWRKLNDPDIEVLPNPDNETFVVQFRHPVAENENGVMVYGPVTTYHASNDEEGNLVYVRADSTEPSQ